MHSSTSTTAGLRAFTGAWDASRFGSNLIGWKSHSDESDASDPTLVSLESDLPDFYISESDFLAYSKYRGASREGMSKVEVASRHDNQYRRAAVFRFLDNVLDRSSGTIHARLRLEFDLVLTPGLLLGSTGRSSLLHRLLVPDSASC